MKNFLVEPVGVVQTCEGASRIVLGKRYAPALAGLEGFSHLNVIWWFSETDNETARTTLQEPAPYRHSPDVLGVFATRSPQRPNPVALSCVEVTYIDVEGGMIGVAYTDAHDGTPVLDIKPYTPSLDRVEMPVTPAWCAHWPVSFETSGDFNWADEFRF